MRVSRAILGVCLAVWCTTSAKAQQACRQALALGLDVSGSVDKAEYRLQLNGLAAALSDPDVQAAVLAFPDAPIRVMVYEWSGLQDQRRLIDWVVLDDLDKIATVVQRLQTTSNAGIGDTSTALGAAMVYGARALAQHPDCWIKTLDISGDGPANLGAHPRDVKGAQLGDIVINGLIIGPNSRANTTKNLRNVKTLEEYYQGFVLRGPGAFAETATDYADFERAMRRKLLREIQSPAISALPALSGSIQ